MPAKSKAQQRLFGMIHAAKKAGKAGKLPASLKKVSKGLSKGSAKDFAKTKHKGLPERVKKAGMGLYDVVRSASFFDEIQKTAWAPKAEDVENKLRVILNEELARQADELGQKKERESFALRHPWLTGIPTLGLWPLIAHEMATDSIARQLSRKDNDLRHSAAEAAKAIAEREHQMKMQQLKNNMIIAPALLAAGVADRYIDSKKNQKKNNAEQDEFGTR